MPHSKKAALAEFAPERAALAKAKRIVVKVGTNLLTGGETRVHVGYVRRLAAAVSALWNDGRQVAIVTSGAIGAGCGVLGFKSRPKLLPERQACAAAGQVELMQLYAQAFHRVKPKRAVGQVLLTRDGLEERHRYLNARHTLEALFERGAVPIVNENDTVSVEEIRFGDNDTLSALVAAAIEADLLVILTDVAGLCDSPPGENPNAKLIDHVPALTPEILALAKPASSGLGTGGMITKLEAAKIVTGAGEPLVLAGGHDPEILLQIVAGRRVGTYFAPRGDRLTARKRWLAFTQRPSGRIKVDAGARDALVKRHKSLLPSGITGVDGRFESGDLVELAGPDGAAFARGLTNFSHAEVEKFQGKRSAQIAAERGAPLFEEVVHRDNLVIL